MAQPTTTTTTASMPLYTKGVEQLIAMAQQARPIAAAAAAEPAGDAAPLTAASKIASIGGANGIGVYSFAADAATPPPRLVAPTNGSARGASASPSPSQKQQQQDRAATDEDGSVAFGWDAVRAGGALLRGPQEPCAPGRSLLDGLLLSLWQEAAGKGLFRYDVTACPTKIIPGDCGFVAQLNEGRATKKRVTEFKLDEVRGDLLGGGGLSHSVGDRG